MFTRLIPGVAALMSEGRLGRLGLYSLEFGRMRGDKILTVLDRLDTGILFPLAGGVWNKGSQSQDTGEAIWD